MVSKQQATYLYPVPAQSNPRLPIPFIYVPLHVFGLNNYDIVYLLTAFGLAPRDSSMVHIYAKTIHRTTQRNTIRRTERT